MRSAVSSWKKDAWLPGDPDGRQVSLRAALACYDEARQYAQQREQFSHPLASFQFVQAKLARMLTEITKAQLLAYRLAQLNEQPSRRVSAICS